MPSLENTWPHGVTVDFSVIGSLVIGQSSFFLIDSARTIFTIWDARWQGFAVGIFLDEEVTTGATGIEAEEAIGAEGAICTNPLLGSVLYKWGSK